MPSIVRVRVRGIELLRQAPAFPDSTLTEGTVILDVLERLRVPADDSVPNVLRVRGYLEMIDLYRNDSVPYRFGGLGGSCWDQGYRRGAEHLLLLARGPSGAWSPYHIPLAPTNVQLRPEGDPWLAWVREQLKTP